MSQSNYRLGLAMYACYFLLFASLFYEKFLKPKTKTASGAFSGDAICNATDAQSCRGVGMMPLEENPAKEKKLN